MRNFFAQSFLRLGLWCTEFILPLILSFCKLFFLSPSLFRASAKLAGSAHSQPAGMSTAASLKISSVWREGRKEKDIDLDTSWWESSTEREHDEKTEYKEGKPTSKWWSLGNSSQYQTTKNQRSRKQETKRCRHSSTEHRWSQQARPAKWEADERQFWISTNHEQLACTTYFRLKPDYH